MLQRFQTFLTRYQDLLLLFALSGLVFLVDLYWVSTNGLPPSWDQASHLARAYGFNYLFEKTNFLSLNWWDNFWLQAPDYRGPATYLVAIPFFKIFGTSFKSAILSNQIFNLSLILSIFFLGRLIKSRSVGLWASFLFAISPIFILQRTDYLIDLSLTSSITLFWLILSLWKFNLGLNQWFMAILSGITLGLIFLTKPTGIVFFWAPFLFLFYLFIKSFIYRKFETTFQIGIILITPILISWNWISLNWLTILTSINKARNWGILYQDGYELSSLDSWFYYPLKTPSITGPLVLGLILSGALLFIIQNKNKFSLSEQKKHIQRALWFNSFPLGGLLICILMSTKDIRFILPIAPQLFILLAFIISSVTSKWSYIWKIFIIITSILGIIWSQFGIGINVNGTIPRVPNRIDNWPIEEIINTIRVNSPSQKSTLGVLTDSKYLNAFNLDAEGIRQANLVASRQTYYQSSELSNDLDYYDWFLLKTGNQGVMSGDREQTLSREIIKSKSFLKEKSWKLPDKSEAFLFKRNPKSIDSKKISCSSDIPIINIKNISNGFELILEGKVNQLNNSLLVIDAKSKLGEFQIDQSVGQGMLRLPSINENDCYQITQRLNSFYPKSKTQEDVIFKIKLLDNLKREITQKTHNIPVVEYGENLDIMANRVQKMSQMGKMLKEGKLEELFSTVGQINQSDPNQVYLKNTQEIMEYRIDKNQEDIINLYTLALSYTLQRKVNKASDTFYEICILDKNNQYAYLAKAFVDLYRFKPKIAKEYLKKAELNTTDNDTLEIISTLRTIANVLSLDLIDLIR